MKSSASESTRNACFNLERLSRSFRRSFYGQRASRLGHKSMEKNSVRNLQYGPANKRYVFCKQFERNGHFSPFELSLAAIKVGV